MSYVTIKEVAQEAEVSVPAVSQVLNNTGRISDATRQRVLDAIAKLNYIPNSAARSMRSSLTKTIGLLVPDIRNSYFASLISAVTEELSKNGYVCLIGSSGESVKGQDTFLRSLLSQRIDGTIIVPQGTISPGLKRFLETDLPVVFLDRSISGIGQDSHIPLIDSDPLPGIEKAIQSARALGHSSIGFVHGPIAESPSLKERQDVFASVAAELLGDDGAVIAEPTDALSAITGLLDRGVRTFIFGYSPDALVAISYFRDHGLVIGKDVSMISFDDIPLFELATPAISVISQQVITMGVRGARTLLGLMRAKNSSHPGPSRAENLRIPTEFIARESVVDFSADPR